VAFTTPDLCDEFGAEVQVADPVFRDFGGVRRFAGLIETVRVQDDNALVREVLTGEGWGRVLVVDGGASLRCALFGGRLADLARANGWSGVVVNGCIRDCVEIAATAVGVKALQTSPRRSGKTGAGERSVPLHFAGVSLRPGAYLYADEDGLIVAQRDLLRP
jgi:regulator of ribonuclease activity A